MKDPSVLIPQSVRVDTTVITQEVAVTDTFVTSVRDTIILEKERLRVRLVRSYDTIQVDAACASDTIRVVKEVFVPQVVYKKDPWYQRWNLFGWLFVALMAFLGLRWLADRLLS